MDGADPDDETIALPVDMDILEALQSVFDGFGFRTVFGIYRLDIEIFLVGSDRTYTGKHEYDDENKKVHAI
jgi:hypothetical protein